MPGDSVAQRHALVLASALLCHPVALPFLCHAAQAPYRASSVFCPESSVTVRVPSHRQKSLRRNDPLVTHLHGTTNQEDEDAIRITATLGVFLIARYSPSRADSNRAVASLVELCGAQYPITRRVAALHLGSVPGAKSAMRHGMRRLMPQDMHFAKVALVEPAAWVRSQNELIARSPVHAETSRMVRGG